MSKYLASPSSESHDTSFFIFSVLINRQNNENQRELYKFLFFFNLREKREMYKLLSKLLTSDSLGLRVRLISSSKNLQV